MTGPGDPGGKSAQLLTWPSRCCRQVDSQRCLMPSNTIPSLRDPVNRTPDHSATDSWAESRASDNHERGVKRRIREFWRGFLGYEANRDDWACAPNSRPRTREYAPFHSHVHVAALCRPSETSPLRQKRKPQAKRFPSGLTRQIHPISHKREKCNNLAPVAARLLSANPWVSRFRFSKVGSSGRTRTYSPPVNSRLLYH